MQRNGMSLTDIVKCLLQMVRDNKLGCEILSIQLETELASLYLKDSSYTSQCAIVFYFFILNILQD